MGDRPALTLPVEKFRSDVDDFDSWISMFEKTVGMCHPTADDAAKTELYLNWLPLKLDDKAQLTYSGVSAQTWVEFKKEFKKALIDPQEEYNWHAHRLTIVWDGVESFQALATRVKRSVDKYDEEGSRQREYFFRFRLALPPDYKRAIDIGCAKENRTIEEARNIAERIRLANAEAGDTTTAPAVTTPTRSVAFTGAAMADDRLKSLELAFQEMSVQVESLKSGAVGGSDSNPRGPRDDSRRRDLSSSRERYDSRYRDRRMDSRGRDDSRPRREDSRGSMDRRGGRRGDDRASDNRDGRFRAFADERRYEDRSRRDSYERRNYDRRNFGRWDYGRQNSYDRRDSYRRPSYDRRDSRDSRYSRDRRESRGRYDSRDRDYGNRDRRFDSRDRRYDSRPRFDSRDRYDTRRPDSRPRQDGDQSRDRDRTQHRLADFDTQVEWICAALSEKELRDREKKSQEN